MNICYRSPVIFPMIWVKYLYGSYKSVVEIVWLLICNIIKSIITIIVPMSIKYKKFISSKFLMSSISVN